MGKICSLSNLELAFLKAVKGKRNRFEVKNFCSCLNENLQKIGRELYEGRYQFGTPKLFTIYDPKKRIIAAAPFRDRIVFHAIMNLCHDRFDKYQIFDSYASRLGKGTYAALERAMHFSNRYPWFAKLDVIKYFDSIDHYVLKRQLSRLFKDKELLSLFGDIIDMSEGNVGVPIGNLTSQYFANHYLAVADHFLTENLRSGPIVRYMDDLLIFSENFEELTSCCRKYESFLEGELHLKLHQPIINKTSSGIPFLGYVVHPRFLRLSRRSAVRFSRKLYSLCDKRLSQEIDDNEYVNRLFSIFSFVMKADSLSLRKKVLNNQEMLSI